MKRVIIGALSAVVVALGGALLAVPDIEAQHRSVNAFQITSYNIEYTLGRDAQQRSVLTTKETITADFPYENVNHGIERSIPHEYKEHPTKLKVVSVEDLEGTSLEYETRKKDDMTTLRIGDPDEYVSGAQTYVITYTQRDVTHYFDNTQRTEWYWDTNGVGWRVPIQNLTISVRLDDGLKDRVEGAPMCYLGAAGATDVCSFSVVDGVYYAVAQGLDRGENVTVSFGFMDDTLAPYKAGPLDIFMQWWKVSVIISIPLAVIAMTILTVLYSRKRNRSRELQPVPVEYIPPKGVSVTTAGQIVLPSGSVFSAQLIDFAVRRYIAVIETKPKRRWVAAEYDIEIVRNPSDLLAEEREVLSDMFGHLPEVGERLSLKRLQHDYAYASRTIDNDAKLTGLIHGEYALREAQPTPSVKSFFRRWALWLGVVAVVMLSPFMAVVALTALIFSRTNKPLTDKGLALRRYLIGLSRYIKAAEKERLKMLQGPDTAVKVGESVNVDSPGQLVKLYERVLPYAVLFGHEREWTKRLGDFYEKSQESPSWYSGSDSSGFNAAVFVAAMTSFSYAASVSAGSSSSSSGGSGGGGSSGGGGGGGGGGGW